MIALDGTEANGGRGNDRFRISGRATPGPGNDIVRAVQSRFSVFTPVNYSAAGHYMVVDLRAGTARGQGFDRLIGVHNVIGSRFNDDIRGDQADNVLFGQGGVDALYGRAGDDTIGGGTGRDLGSGGPGLDQCDSEVELLISCVIPTD